MHRIVVILAILAIGESKPRHYHHSWEINDHPDIFFKSLSRQVRDIDRKSLRFCNAQNNTATEEIYNTDSYKLMIPLTGFTEDMITIKLKHRVIFIDAKGTGEDAKRFAEVRILPQNTDCNKSSWLFKDGQLEVTAPYKIAIGKKVKINCDFDCHHLDDNDAFVVPKA